MCYCAYFLGDAYQTWRFDQCYCDTQLLVRPPDHLMEG